MSDSLTSRQPAIAEPSNITPWSSSASVHRASGEAEMLPPAAKVREAEVDGLDVLASDLLEDGCAIAMIVSQCTSGTFSRERRLRATAPFGADRARRA